MNFEELAARLETEGFNKDSYCIGNGWQRLFDGHALDVIIGGYDFFYVERGQKSLIKSFDDENEACNFAYSFFENDKWAKSHMIGFFDSSVETERLISKLRAASIEYFTDEIPYGGKNDPRFRVFVFGTDFQKVKESNLRAEIKIF